MKATVTLSGDSIILDASHTIAQVYSSLSDPAILDYSSGIYTLYDHNIVVQGPSGEFVMEDETLILDNATVYTDYGYTGGVIHIEDSIVRGTQYNETSHISINQGGVYEFEDSTFGYLGRTDAVYPLGGIAIYTNTTGNLFEDCTVYGLGIHGVKIFAGELDPTHYGYGGNVVIEDLTAYNMSERVVSVNNADNVTVTYIHDCYDIGHYLGSFIVYVDNSTNVLVEDCEEIEGIGEQVPYTAFVKVYESSNVNVTGNSNVEGFDYGIVIDWSHNVLVNDNSYFHVNNDFADTIWLLGNETEACTNISFLNNHDLNMTEGYWGLHFYTVKTGVIRGNYNIYGSITDAIGIEDNCTDIIIEDNYNLYENNIGIAVDCCHDITVRNNTGIYDNRYAGIRVVDGFRTSTDFTWLGAGSDVLKVYNVTVEDCTVTNNGHESGDSDEGAGILVQGILGYPYNIYIEDNIVTNNRRGVSIHNRAYEGQPDPGEGGNVTLTDNTVAINSNFQYDGNQPYVLFCEDMELTVIDMTFDLTGCTGTIYASGYVGGDFNLTGEYVFATSNGELTVEALTGSLTGENLTLSLTHRMGSLEYDSLAACEIQVSHNLDRVIKLSYDGFTLSTLTDGYLWNGTIANGESPYLKWSFNIVLPHEENFMLYIGLTGLFMFAISLIWLAWAIRKHGIFTMSKTSVFELDYIPFIAAGSIIGGGLILVWLMS